jgi:hypothetical protein
LIFEAYDKGLLIAAFWFCVTDQLPPIKPHGPARRAVSATPTIYCCPTAQTALPTWAIKPSISDCSKPTTQLPSRGSNCVQARTCAGLAALGLLFRAYKPACATGLYGNDGVTHLHRRPDIVPDHPRDRHDRHHPVPLRGYWPAPH